MTYYEDGPAETMQEHEQEDFEGQADQHTEEHEMPRPVGARFSEFRGRISRAISNLDRGQLGIPEEDLGDPEDVLDSVSGAEYDMGLGGEEEIPAGDYDATAAEARIVELERELEELRARRPPMSVAEELERLGEQTASILVVAHDQAHETKRLAQEQADSCIADAAANAVAITEKAKRELRELDEETDSVWRERARLLDDARAVGAALIALTDEAAERFPEDAGGKTIEVSRLTPQD
jgi:hypothetical protein